MPKRNNQMKEVRTQIVRTYAGWTALSALRSGSRVKSRAQTYRLLEGVPFTRLLEPPKRPIKAAEFASWHRDAVLSLCESEPLLGVGWAAKMLNVYLKTSVYVGGWGDRSWSPQSTLPSTAASG